MVESVVGAHALGHPLPQLCFFDPLAKTTQAGPSKVQGIHTNLTSQYEMLYHEMLQIACQVGPFSKSRAENHITFAVTTVAEAVQPLVVKL